MNSKLRPSVERPKRDPFEGDARSEINGGRILPVLLLSIGLVAVQRIILLLSAISEVTRHGEPLIWKRLLVTGYSKFDSGWYIEIAQHGYMNLKQTAFWPMYPWAIRYLHQITGLSYATSGVSISLVCFVAALFFLGRLVGRNFGMRTAVASMALYAFFPTSYYFDAVYTEALFMALLISAAYFANTGRFATASILAAFGTLTRNTGILICLVIFVEYLRYRQTGWRFWTVTWWRKLGWPVLWMGVVPLALIAYCLRLKAQFDKLFPFLAAEKFWHRQYMAPWRTFAGTIGLYIHPHRNMMSKEYVLFEITMFSFAALLLLCGLFVARKSATRWSWWVYSLAVMWITSTEPSLNLPDYLVSFPRYVLMMFPGFIFFGRVFTKWFLFVPLAIAFAIVLYMKSGSFYLGQWIA